MSNTPKMPDECKKLLDNGWQIRLFRNELGSYTARAIRPRNRATPKPRGGCIETDDFEPSQALYRLTEKVFGHIV